MIFSSLTHRCSKICRLLNTTRKFSGHLGDNERVDVDDDEDNSNNNNNKAPVLLLTSWSRVLLEKLPGFQLVKKFPEFYGTRRFITAFTSARHLSLKAPAFQFDGFMVALLPVSVLLTQQQRAAVSPCGCMPSSASYYDNTSYSLHIIRLARLTARPVKTLGNSVYSEEFAILCIQHSSLTIILKDISKNIPLHTTACYRKDT